MPRARKARRSLVRAVLIIVVGMAVSGVEFRPVRAEHAPPTVALSGPERRPFAPRGPARRGGDGRAEDAGGWWLGTAGITLALAVGGAVCMASRRYLPQPAATSGPALRVVGRTRLSPKQTVYLLQAGARVLVVGTGGQGAPTLLGEWTEPPADAPRPEGEA